MPPVARWSTTGSGCALASPAFALTLRAEIVERCFALVLDRGVMPHGA
jgi:hypothetical protein